MKVGFSIAASVKPRSSAVKYARSGGSLLWALEKALSDEQVSGWRTRTSKRSVGKPIIKALAGVSWLR